jgi:hypothetical protein
MPVRFINVISRRVMGQPLGRSIIARACEMQHE